MEGGGYTYLYVEENDSKFSKEFCSASKVSVVDYFLRYITSLTLKYLARFPILEMIFLLLSES